MIQYNFVIIFFNPSLDIELYMELSSRINKSNQIIKLLKIIYNLKQIFWLWFKALIHLFILLKFFQLFFEFFIFIGSYKKMYFIVAIYVNKLLIFNLQNNKTFAELIKKLKN